MGTMLVKNPDLIITMDGGRSRIQSGSIFVRDNVIEKIGRADELPSDADVVIDATGMAILPGLINTHHHFYQTLTRAVPGSQDEELFDWLVRLYPIWGEMTEEAVYISTQTAMAEMILSGCTTSSDHLYLYPNNATADAQVRAAQDIGMRFHVTRGSMSLGRSKGGLPPDHVVQEEDEILADCQRVIETHHDPDQYAMLRVALAPCSPFSVTDDLMRKAAELARSYDGVMLHTHVAETRDEEAFCVREFGARPAVYMEKLGWVGPDVWWAHAIFLDDDEIKMLAETGTGVAHCPSSNMRLGSGIARVRDMLDAGVKVGIGVDGSASNDSCHVITEARLAMLLQRVAGGAGVFSVQEGIELATLGSASVLGRDDIGQLAPNKAADFIGVKLDKLSLAGGAVHDPLGALLLCTIDRVDLSVINGKVILQDGEFQTLNLVSHVKRHNEIAKEMVSRHPEPERFKLV
ncbi:MAG: 8-oxoguanine deaminase [Anaerolineales bacterium]|nr:8-oxoguanine deaminase [Anaerolineales bacterium]